MARFAGHSAGMFGCVHLRESCWLGDVLLMAPRANDGRIRKHRLQSSGIFRMFGQRPVAGFAIHMRMFAMAFGVGDVGVAGLAGLMASIVDGFGRKFTECGATIVAIFAESFRNQDASYYQEAQYSHQKDGCQPEQMA